MTAVRHYTEQEIRQLARKLETGRYSVLLYLAHKHQAAAFASKDNKSDALTASALYEQARQLLASIKPKTAVNVRYRDVGERSIEGMVSSAMTTKTTLETANSAPTGERTIPCEKCNGRGRVYRFRNDRTGGRCLRCDGTGYITREQHIASIGFDPEQRLLQLKRRRAVLEWLYRDDARRADFRVLPADYDERWAREDDLADVINDKIALALEYYASDERVNSAHEVTQALQAIQAAFADRVFYQLDEAFVKQARMENVG